MSKRTEKESASTVSEKSTGKLTLSRALVKDLKIRTSVRTGLKAASECTQCLCGHDEWEYH